MFSLLGMLIATGVGAQETTPASPPTSLFESMLPATQKILVVDSIVVSRDHFLEHIPLLPSHGKMEQTDEVFHFTNGYGFARYSSTPDAKGKMRTYVEYKEGNGWSEKTWAKELGEASCPFMMGDGATLYFARKGEGSVGGTDIFVTRYDHESGAFLKPQNVGFPFNSAANEYLYAVDEENRLAWLVTDRRQPDGMVCIYTLVPPDGHEVYDINANGADKVRARAAISAIADTWDGRNEELTSARQRWEALKTDYAKPAPITFAFPINDQTIYTKANDFKTPENNGRLAQLAEMQQMLSKNTASLDQARQKYHEASALERAAMSDDILKAEKEQEQLIKDIANMEQRIRNAEIEASTTKQLQP